MKTRWLGVALGVAVLATATAPAAAQETPRGRVVHAKGGKPVADVTVCFESAQQPLHWHGELWGATTGADGRFAITADQIGGRLIAIDPAVGCSDWVKVPAKGPVTLKLVPGNTIEGEVHGPAESGPLAGIPVTLVLIRGENDETAGLSAVTDAKGRYRFAGVPPGFTVRPSVEPSPRIRGLAAPIEPVTHKSTGGKATRDLTVDERPGVRVTWTLRLPAGSAPPERVMVTHVTVTRDPLPPGGDGGGGMSAKAMGDGGFENVTSQARDGMLETRTEKGTWVALRAEDPRVTLYLPTGTNVVRIKAGALGASLPTRTVEARGPAETHDLALEAQARIMLQVLDAAGKPWARAGVSVSLGRTVQQGGGMSGSSTHAGYTDARGQLDLTERLAAPDDPEPGTSVSIQVNCSGDGLTFPDGSGFRWTPAELRALAKTSGGDGIVWLGLKAAELPAVTLRLLDETGAPVANEWLMLSIPGASRATTDAEGRARIFLPAGTHPGVTVQMRQGIEVDPIPSLAAPSAEEIVIRVRRVLLQHVPIEIAGVPAQAGANPGPVTVQALDANGADAGNALANLTPHEGRWGLFIRAPGATRKLVITLRGKTLEVDTPDGRPRPVDPWTLP